MFFPGFFLFPLFLFGAFFLIGGIFRGAGRFKGGHTATARGRGTTRAGAGSRSGRASGTSASTARRRATEAHADRLSDAERGGGAVASAPRAREARTMQRILVVEDEMQIARNLRDYLEVAGFDVTVVGDGLRGARERSGRPARPRRPRSRAARAWTDSTWRASSGARRTMPIVMLTARGEESDRIVGLELGADDYLVKPFSPKELVARVRAVLRRTSGAAAGAEILRARRRRGRPAEDARARGGRPVDLTPTEFQLLATLVREPGRVFTRGQLLDALHGVTIESYERAIDAHVKNLRRKIEPEVGRPRYILTVHGVGYRFADD